MIVNVLNNVKAQQLTAFSIVLIKFKSIAYTALTKQTTTIVNRFSKIKEHRYE